MIRARAAAFVILAALLCVACGEDEEASDQFREGYNAAIERLNEVNTNLQESGQELSSQPGSKIAREFRRIAATAAETRANLAELEPPEGARDEFDELLAAIEQGVTDIRAVASAARQEDQERFREATEALEQSGEEISEAETRLKDAVQSG